MESTLYQKILREIVPFKKWFILAVVLAVIISFLAPVRPFFIQYIIDHDILNKDKNSLFTHTIYLFLLLTLESFLRYFF
jgi:ABC-type multidrug transport system fused ATPase/permease subunit